MLTQSHTPVRRVSQAPTKFTTCLGGCGATVEFRTNPRVCCPVCQLERHRARARATSEKKQQLKGVPRVKGVLAPCPTCGANFTRTSGRQVVCKSCALEVTRERARSVSRAKTGVAGAYAYDAKWRRERRHSVPGYAINWRIKIGIWRSLRGNKQGRKWEDLVGYTLQDLLRHLERQFQSGMFWGNRSDWHIDHILPLSSFQFDSPDCPEFRAAWALSNLRPLWAGENLKKNAKRLHLI